VPGTPPTGIRRWLRISVLPFGRHSFQPYGPHIIQSRAMTQFLLEKGVDVNTRLVLYGDWTPPGIGNVVATPLHVALSDNRVEIARLLLAHGADVHARDAIGRSPLTVAITYCPSAIEPLLASGVDINEQTRFGPPLLAAARYQWLYAGRRPVVQERENAVKILLEKGADPNTRDSEGRNALMVMSMENRSESARFGRTVIVNITPPPPTPARPSVIRGVPGSEQERESVVAAAKTVWSLSEAHSEAQSDRALRLIGEALLQAECDVNAADSDGRTPLMYAALYNRPTAVRLLLKGGANIKAKDKGGMTALDLAEQFGNKEIIIRLREPRK
jgi:ankyrin repeat protein